MQQTYDLVENMCNLYASVNASPNVGKFALLKYLKDHGWHCELYSVTHDLLYTKLSRWCLRRYGTVYDDVHNSRGIWYHFVNNTGQCTDYVFAFRNLEDYTDFIRNRNLHILKDSNV